MKNKLKDFLINPLNKSDANRLYQFLFDNKERLKFFFPVTLDMNSSLEKAAEYIATKNKEIEEKTNFNFAIRENEYQNIVGLIIIKKIDWDKKQGEFAYCIDSKFEGKGVTSFAVKEMIKFAFDELGLKTIQIIAHKTNFGSIKVALNNSFTWQKTLEKEFTPIDGTPLDMELYELKNL